MKPHWNILPTAPKTYTEKFPELSPLVATLLHNRNLNTQQEIDHFLHPDYARDVHDPFLFQDMDKAVRRIFEAMEKHQKITIHGDYDADGVSGAVILTDVFNALQYPHVDVFLPHRDTDGYGLNVNTIQKLHDQESALIITCDCGISNKKEVEKANELGMDVIITDHHTLPKELPPAHSIIHPKRADETYPDKNLAGGAVAFKLMQGILRHHKKNNDTLPDGTPHEGLEKWLLDMVAIASVADMVPLIGESRTLTAYGLLVLNKTKRIGLQKLLLEAKLMHNDGSLPYPIDSDTIGFKIAPRINAAGRIGHANVAYNLLIAKEPTEAVDLAYRLDQNNQERRKITDELFAKGLKQLSGQEKDPIIFVIGDSWPPGLVGLIAGKIKQQTKKPTIVMSKGDEIMGSGRSIDGFNFVQAMQKASSCFSKFGGHPMAGGFTLDKDTSVKQLKKALIAQYRLQEKDHEIKEYTTIDAEISLNDITWDLYDSLEKFEPFGQGNPKPCYIARDAEVEKVVSMGKQGNHMRLSLKHNGPKIHKAVGWRMCGNDAEQDWCALLKKGDIIDIVFEVNINEWNGNRELQLIIRDIDKQ